jgi:peptidoglycan/LPS O-acetylase OafA/YrhL
VTGDAAVVDRLPAPAAAPATASADEPPRPVGVATTVAYMPELEGLRGIAMLMVLVFHSDGFIHVLRPQQENVSLPYALVRNGGDVGVELFFVLSAFLLTLPFWIAARTGRDVSVAGYFRRRALRILPLYYTMVALGTLANATRPADLLAAVPYLLFLNSFAGWTQPLAPFSGGWWSLATEWQFYIVLGLAALLARARPGRVLLVVALIGWAAAYAAWLRGLLMMQSVAGQWTLGFSAFGRAPAFLAGAAVAWLVARGAVVARASRRAALTADLAFLAAFVALAAVMQWVVSFGKVRVQAVPWHVHHIAQALLCAALVAIVVATPTHVRALLRCRPLVALGVLSYSMYVWHIPLLRSALEWADAHGLARMAAGWTLQNATAVVLLWGVCIALSTVTYRFVERPFLRRKQRPSLRRRPA